MPTLLLAESSAEGGTGHLGGIDERRVRLRTPGRLFFAADPWSAAVRRVACRPQCLTAYAESSLQPRVDSVLCIPGKKFAPSCSAVIVSLVMAEARRASLFSAARLEPLERATVDRPTVDTVRSKDTSNGGVRLTAKAVERRFEVPA